MGDGDDGIVAAPGLDRAGGDQRTRVSLRIKFLQAALRKHQKCRDLGWP